MLDKIHVSFLPHIKENISIAKINIFKIISLIPASIGSIYFFGLRCLWIILISVISAVATEFFIRFTKNEKITIHDGNAVWIGFALALTLPPLVPLWIPAIGSFFAIAIVKELFGGAGSFIPNPIMSGYIFLLFSWKGFLTESWTIPINKIPEGLNVITKSIPLQALKDSQFILSNPDLYSLERVIEANKFLADMPTYYWSLLFGFQAGNIGETSVVLLLIGSAFLLYRRIIGWKVPLNFIITVAIMSWIFGGQDDYFKGNVIFNLLSGGLVFGAFFIATDHSSSPTTKAGRIIFGVGCGIITSVIRIYGSYYEGVAFAILIMSTLVPVIDKYALLKRFGQK
jgi:electron transport complex protein RnfD